MTLTAVTNRKELAKAMASLQSHLRAGAKVVKRTVTFPGTHGPIKNAEVIWRKRSDFWVCFQNLSTRYWCAYGTCRGSADKTLNIGVEINPPRQGLNRNVRGQIVKDEAGEYYLAHKGGLGGGRGGSVTIADFWKLFDQQKLKTVTWKEDGRHAKMHIIGRIGKPELYKGLGHFVGEADRIRDLARSGQLKKTLRSIEGRTRTVRPLVKGSVH